MKKLFPLILLACLRCGVKSTDTNSPIDSVRVDSSKSITSLVDTEPGQTRLADRSLADSLRNHKLAVYHGEYALSSSSSAEQARLTLSFIGNNTFNFFLDFQVADYCGNSLEGSFSVDADNTGTYAVQSVLQPNGDESSGSEIKRPITFILADRRVELSDPQGQLDVGTCEFSGTFNHCDGPCAEISWEGFGEDSGESDGEDPNDSISQH